MKSSLYKTLVALLTAGLFQTACGSSKNKQNTAEAEESHPAVNVPTFCADSAYAYVARQTDFGPRVPNSAAHRKCGDYLAAQLQAFGAQVHSQEAELVAYDGTVLKGRNLIGVYRPECKKRVMLCAHWDSRPYADESDEAHHRTPIDGANDGASGVGVLLEIARQLQAQPTEIGIDIVFFDAEDYGTPSFYNGPHREDTWCLGSQYWGRRPHVADYKARFAILLDMVGGKNATFHYEGYTQRTASKAMKKIWETAHRIGYGQYFVQSDGGEVTDDHVYVNSLRQIPCVDIIDFNPNTETGFNTTWHTLNDGIRHIEKATLQAVGQTVMTVIYNEH